MSLTSAQNRAPCKISLPSMVGSLQMHRCSKQKTLACQITCLPLHLVHEKQKQKASICVSDLASRHRAEVAMIAYSNKQNAHGLVYQYNSGRILLYKNARMQR